MSDPVFATLGPKGSNHDLVLETYLTRKGIIGTPWLCSDFDAALQSCATRDANRILICAAHASCAKVVGEAQYRLGLAITDVFVCASQPLAILHRTQKPRTIALHPSTRSYTDFSGYDQIIDVGSTVEAAQGLMAGKWDAALTARRFAQEGLTIALELDPPRDAWLVLGGEDQTPVWGLQT